MRFTHLKGINYEAMMLFQLLTIGVINVMLDDCNDIATEKEFKVEGIFTEKIFRTTTRLAHLIGH